MAILDKFGLHGKVALVAGAGRNLGKEIAIAFAEAGADVAVTPKERFSGFPLQRVANPLDVVPLAVYLVSEACTYTTGEVIMVDGGGP